MATHVYAQRSELSSAAMTAAGHCGLILRTVRANRETT
jgi:hypothetical protein